MISGTLLLSLTQFGFEKSFFEVLTQFHHFSLCASQLTVNHNAKGQENKEEQETKEKRVGGETEIGGGIIEAATRRGT